MNLIAQYTAFIQPYVQKQCILDQIETVPVSDVYLNGKTNSYTKLQTIKPSIASNEETYISLRHEN